MPDNNKTEGFLQKLAPCIGRGELEKCVEEAARVAGEMGIGAEELLDLVYGSGKLNCAYVLALAAAQGLEGEEKAKAYHTAGLVANSIGKLKEAEVHYKKAEEQFLKAINADPKDPKKHNNYALLLQDLHKKKEAEEQFLEAIKSDPKYADAHYNYALLLIESDRKKEAEEQYLKAIEADPKHADAHNNYAILLKELNGKKEAEEHYLKAIEADPKDADARYNYAILLIELNKETEAEEQIKKAIEINSKLVNARTLYAELLRRKGLLIDAEKEVRLAFQIEPKNPYARGTLGDILADEGLDFEEAKKEYDKALKNSASMEASAIAEIHNNLGYAYAQLKQYSEAKEEFRQACRLDPLNAKARHNYRALNKVEEGINPEISKIQKYLAAVLSISLVVLFISFLFNKLSEAVFATQSTILIALLIFILLYHEISKFKAGAIEFEKSTEQRSQLIEAISKIER